MSGPRRSQPDADEKILDELFAHPPVSSAELSGRLAAAEPRRLRELLVQRLRERRVGAAESGVFQAIFGRLGVAEARDALASLVLDPRRTIPDRARALAVLVEDDPGSLEELLAQLSDEEIAPLAEQWLAELLGGIQADERQGEILAETLEAAPPPMRPFLFEQIEAVRQRVGTSAAAAYGRALRCPVLRELQDRMLAMVVEEARPEGIALLEHLWKQSPPGERRRELHGAVFRARTRRIEPAVGPAPQGHAFVGSCDGQGAFILFGCFENADGTITIADLCVKVAADIRDGFVLPRRARTEVDCLLDEISQGTGIRFARVELGEAARLVRAAASRTRELDVRLPPDALPAVELFERVETGPAPAVDEAEAVVPSLGEVRELLARPEYERSWFFDRGDLDAAGIALPAANEDLQGWADQAAEQLQRPALAARIAAMARHMARWHSRMGQPELAGLCAGAARATETDFKKSPLVVAMLERSLVPADEEGSDQELDRIMLRQHLKGLFFQHVCAPKGRDLARLDFTEAALVFLEEALLGLPGERRPREDQRTIAAYTIGKIFADFLIAGALWPIERVMSQMHRSLAEYCQLDDAECRRVVAVVLPALGDYIEQHCAACPIACLDRPAADVGEAFFAPEHPAGRGAGRSGTEN